MPRKAKPVPLMTTAQAAAHLNISKSKLEKMRGRPGGPSVVEVDRCRRYRQSDLDDWVATQVVTSAQSRRPRPAAGRSRRKRTMSEAEEGKMR